MKTIIGGFFMAIASCSPALAIPNLQLYSPAPGVYYDYETESWIIPHLQYDLWVIGAHLEIKDVKIAFAVPSNEDGSITVAHGVTSQVLDESLLITLEDSLKETVYNGETPFFVEEGTPRMGNNTEVPPGGVFPSSFYQYYVGDLEANKTQVSNYTPGESWMDTAMGDIAVLTISVQGYSYASMIAYDHVVLGNNKVKYVKTPYSHDGGSTTPVPEPGTLFLLGSGLVTFAIRTRRKVQKQ